MNHFTEELSVTTNGVCINCSIMSSYLTLYSASGHHDNITVMMSLITVMMSLYWCIWEGNVLVF